MTDPIAQDRPADVPALAIVADIGGTNTRVAMARGAVIDPGTIRRFANADHPALESVLAAYLADRAGPPPSGACVAVAGPVRDGVAAMTNLDWTIRPENVAAATGAGRVAILNDLQAQGHALGRLAPGALRTILPGRGGAPAGASQLVIGVGTGFNAAPVHDGRGERFVAASECGHITLPVRSDADARLSAFIARAHGFPEVEEALSGRGLERIHAWVATEAGQDPGRDAAAIMAAIGTGTDPLAEATGQTFIRLLAAVAGDLALIHLPFGGVCLIGGVARAFTAHYDRFGFGAHFRDKGRFSDLMDSFPVHIIEDDYAALTGCAAHLAALMRP